MCLAFMVKYLLFFFNLVLWLAGLALLGVGIAVQLKVSAITDILIEDDVSVAPVLVIVIGSIVFCVTFFGCYGAIKESKCMLVMYSVFMLILMALMITLASLIFVSLNGLLNEIPMILNVAFVNNLPVFQSTVEATFQCCGTISMVSYLCVSLPDTCCATPPCTLISSYNGCIVVVTNFVTTFGDVIAYFAIIIAVIELLSVVAAIRMIITISKNKQGKMYV